MSAEQPGSNQPLDPTDDQTEKDNVPAEPGSAVQTVAEQYRKYRDAEREEERRLERYERTKSTETERTKDGN